jgi:diguanylate cyclase (GGDEF)-like protein
MAAASVHTDDLLEPRNAGSGRNLAAGAASLAVAATIAVAVVVPPELSARHMLFGLVLVAAAAFASGLRMIIDGSNTQSAPREPLIVCAAVVLGPTAAAIIGTLSGARLLPSPRSASVYYASAGALQGIAAALAARAVLELAPQANVIVVSTTAAVVAGAVWLVTREVAGLVRRVPSRRPVLPGVAAETLVSVALSPAIILLYQESGVAAASAFIVVFVGGFAAFNAYRKRLLTLQAAVEQLARTDSLTGAANRRAFDERLDHELGRSARSGHGLGVVLVDTDDFKQVNDVHGHRAGDIVLAEVSTRLRARLRECDLLARFGGDEFAAIVVDIHDTAELESLVDDLCRAVRVEPVDCGGPIAVTVSVGAALSTSPSTPEAILGDADAALYAAKAAGRDRGRVTG